MAYPEADGDPRFTSGMRLTPVFGAGTRRASHEVPAFGSAEHLALMSGSLDLGAIEDAASVGPLVGFAPIVLDPRGPDAMDAASIEGGADPLPPYEHPGARREPVGPVGPVEHGGPVEGRERPRRGEPLPSRRSLRAAATSPALGRRLSSGVLPGALPAPRPAQGVTTALPPTTGALRVQDVEEALAAVTARPPCVDPTPTGELARPFVSQSLDTDLPELADVPPPVSVDVFQRAVRAGLAIDDTETLKVLEEQVRAGVARSRREIRARERAAASPRSVTVRRLAKGGVLAITALGVVSAAAPQGLTAFGLAKDSPARNVLDGSAAFGASALTPVQAAQARQAQVTQNQAQQGQARQSQGGTAVAGSNVPSTDALRAGIQAGGAMAALAQQRDQQVLAARQVAADQAVRNAQDDPETYAKLLLERNGMGDGQFQCLDALWDKESGWDYRATNPVSNAYGIAQALPGSKMNSVGADWRTNPVTQIKWGLQYITERYGTPCGAWSHSEATGWY